MTIYKDKDTGEHGLVRQRGFLEFFDIDTGEPYDFAILAKGTPSEKRYVRVKEVDSEDEFMDFLRRQGT